MRIQDDFNSGLHADAINEQRLSLMVDHNGAGGTERAGKGSLEEWSMQEVIKRFARDESSATAIEYGLIAAGISVCDYRHCSTCGNKPDRHVPDSRKRTQINGSKQCPHKAPATTRGFFF